MKILASNNASTVLAAGISASATSLTVATGSGSTFPTPVSGTSYFKLTLIDAATESINEIVHVTAVSGDTFTIVRGQEGTSARIWSVNDIASNMITAGTISAMAQYDTAEFLAATSGRLVNVQFFAASAPYTPTAGATWAIVEIVGASGGSGGVPTVPTGQSVCTSPSSQGTYVKAIVRNLSNQQITIGQPGTGQGSVNIATSGGQSSFGNLIICPGGGGSYPAQPTAGGITPSVGTPSGPPTIANGIQVIGSIYNQIAQNAIQSTFGVATNWRVAWPGPFPGFNYGRSTDGVYLGQNNPAYAGNTGYGGACRIWEYA
ncbi:tail fiber protein [Pantoea phage PdC23]|uniref:Tail fiber protein n=1 Tax=Pantoea phage PdC23 TaxID=2894356 RepID=A0AAE9C7U1_9CAUD|nr:tail fiber protein [Pantoea phage PdC23]UGC97736.1 tail fiber protein [Pantoea phage PdC23]